MKTNMQVREIAKPVIGKRTGVGQAFSQFLKETNLPINDWCRKQKQLLAGKKF